MFSITFRTHVLQTAMCVTFSGRRRSVPFRLLRCTLATLAVTVGQETRDEPALSGLNSEGHHGAPYGCCLAGLDPECSVLML